MLKKIALSTSQAPAPIAHYAQGAQIGRLVQVSGQMPADPATGELVAGIEAQTRRSLDNVVAILAEANATFENVIMTRVWLTDYAHFETMDKIYRTYAGAPAPARMTCYVGLPPGMLVEVDVLAVVPEATQDS
jgi:2-iminobutanoate/2-iminopropanoate deaminase